MKSLLLCVVVCCIVYLFIRLRFWLGQGKLMQKSGHLPPPPTLLAKLLLGVVSRIVVFCCVGKVLVIGHKQTKFHGRLAVAANHSYFPDFFILRKALGFGCDLRYLAKVEQLKGRRGPWAAWSGCVPVDANGLKGAQSALQASVSVMAHYPKSRLVVFPQAGFKPHGPVLAQDCKTGTVRIITTVQCENCDQPAAILPAAIYYRTENEDNHWSHFLFKPLRKLAGPRFYGAIVVFGAPMLACDLPKDPREATELLAKNITELFDAAVEVSGRGCCTG